MRIAIAGISGKCDSFSLDVMTESIFDVTRGAELLDRDFDAELLPVVLPAR